jgi:hypothetical protein
MQRLIRIGPVVHVARRRAGVKCGRLGQKPLVKAVQGWWLVAWGLLVAGGAAGLLAVLCLVAVDLASGGFFVGGGELRAARTQVSAGAVTHPASNTASSRDSDSFSHFDLRPTVASFLVGLLGRLCRLVLGRGVVEEQGLYLALGHGRALNIKVPDVQRQPALQHPPSMKKAPPISRDMIVTLRFSTRRSCVVSPRKLSGRFSRALRARVRLEAPMDGSLKRLVQQQAQPERAASTTTNKSYQNYLTVDTASKEPRYLPATQAPTRCTLERWR